MTGDSVNSRGGGVGEVVNSRVYAPLCAFSEAIMVLSQRPDTQSLLPSQRVFIGNEDVQMFFFYFENVLM